MPAAEPPIESAPSESVERTRIGRLTYTARHRDPGDGNFVSDYEVRCGERVVQRLSMTCRWRMPTREQLESELADAGLTLTLLPSSGVGVVMRRRSASSGTPCPLKSGLRFYRIDASSSSTSIE
ncbi:hypothetical protein [Microcella alkalica]|uniref:Uncharacterized protein n=1 Tax=Microcella alkalica TaxID=355930 RepID=A0A839EBA2_9MICO|nr:hypothetical protein [Microcella alkalica]MBA8847732.1 hypothetical protein [Microcella alkalica]